MKAFFVYSTDFGRGRPVVRAAAVDARLRTFIRGDAPTLIARALRAGGADIIAGTSPFLASPGR